VPKIATPFQNKVRAPIKDLPYLRKLKLAHPVTSDENFEISLLIGADHYWDFVEDHIIRENGQSINQSINQSIKMFNQDTYELYTGGRSLQEDRKVNPI
jgi:hypothetical protein